MKFSSTTYSLLVASLFFLFSCKQTVPEDLQKVNDQKAAYKASPNKQTAAGYIAAVSLYSTVHSGEAKTKELLTDAYNIATKEGQSIVAAGITNEIVKQFPQDPENKSRILTLANEMQKMGRKEAGLCLNYFLSKKYPDFAAEKGIVLPDGLPEDPKAFITMKAQQIFDKNKPNSLDRNASFQYVDAAEAYALIYSDNSDAPQVLFNAAEVAKTVGTFKKSLSLYDWVITKYPSYKDVPTAMFLKAFILEDNMKNEEAAREAYNEFLAKFPQHHFADDAQFSLNNLGKTEAEIQEELERLQQQNNASK